ncbi:MAG: hypothetical protein ABIH23_07815 [bacterium]
MKRFTLFIALFFLLTGTGFAAGQLSIEDKAVLAHVVVDPDAWVAHALATVGDKAVKAKIEKYRADYLANKDLPGYQTRAEREALLKAK